ncbi:MAG TPA: hypothetical protein VFE51_22905 [Verrucomicrobiae bacterium]|nr:hypothetical protein [Verrucomicrobiae bacterium]
MNVIRKLLPAMRATYAACHTTGMRPGRRGPHRSIYDLRRLFNSETGNRVLSPRVT